MRQNGSKSLKLINFQSRPTLQNAQSHPLITQGTRKNIKVAITALTSTQSSNDNDDPSPSLLPRPPAVRLDESARIRGPRICLRRPRVDPRSRPRTSEPDRVINARASIRAKRPWIWLILIRERSTWLRGVSRRFYTARGRRKIRNVV